MENRFITNLETQPCNPVLIFQHTDLFVDPEIHQEISQILKVISANTGAKSASKKGIEGKSLYETHISHFILWISNPLKEEIFVELSIIVSLLRIVTLCCIWAEINKEGIVLKEDSLEINVEGIPAVSLKLSKQEISELESFTKHSISSLFTGKWSEIKKLCNGNLLLNIITEAKKIPEIEDLFYCKLQAFSILESEVLDYATEALLNLRETELKDSLKSSKKFYFLNWNTKEDLKELIQKLSEWLHCFDERELQIQDIGLL